jgi:hypothetical protein
MKPVVRYKSQLLFRKSYKPNRVISIRRTGKLKLVFRPTRQGPKLNCRAYLCVL